MSLLISQGNVDTTKYQEGERIFYWTINKSIIVIICLQWHFQNHSFALLLVQFAWTNPLCPNVFIKLCVHINQTNREHKPVSVSKLVIFCCRDEKSDCWLNASSWCYVLALQLTFWGHFLLLLILYSVNKLTNRHKITTLAGKVMTDYLVIATPVRGWDIWDSANISVNNVKAENKDKQDCLTEFYPLLWVVSAV